MIMHWGIVQCLAFKVSSSKMSEKFFKAENTIGFAFTVALEHAILELFSAVGAEKTLRVKLLCHGSDHPADDVFLTDAALVLLAICLVKS